MAPKMAHHGMDISKHQGNVDWSKVAADFKAGKVDFVILRAGYGGGTIDPRFEEYYSKAVSIGIPIGAYWYAYWGPYTPVTECTSFLKAVEGKILTYGIWYDVEYEPAITSLSKTERTNKVLEGLNKLAESGRYVGLYASTDMINNRLEYSRLSNFDIWVAQYAKNNTCKLPYGMWQYTSSGSVSGINGRVDRDWSYKDYPSVVVGKLAGYKSETPNPTPEVPPVQKPAESAPVEKHDPIPPVDHEPRQTTNLEITINEKDKFYKVLQTCVDLGLFVMGTVEVELRQAVGPDDLICEAIDLELLTVSNLMIGPMSKGDLVPIAESTFNCGMDWTIHMQIGPVSTGDTATLTNLAKSLELPVKEVL